MYFGCNLRLTPKQGGALRPSASWTAISGQAAWACSAAAAADDGGGVCADGCSGDGDIADDGGCGDSGHDILQQHQQQQHQQQLALTR